MDAVFLFTYLKIERKKWIHHHRCGSRELDGGSNWFVAVSAASWKQETKMRKKNEIQRPVMWWVIEADRKELRNEPPSTKRQSNRRKRTPQESVFFESFQSYQVSHRDVWESIYNRRRPKMRFFQPSLEKEKKNEWKKRRNPLFFQVFTNSQLVHDYVLLTTFFFFSVFFFDSQVILVVVL